MRIASRTPEKLVVVSRPWVLFVLATILGISPVLGAIVDTGETIWLRLFLLALGGIMSWVIWRYLPMTTVAFDRPNGLVTVTHHRITGNTRTTHDLTGINGAMYQANWSDGARLERLALRGHDGPIPVEFGYFSGQRSHIADQINDWFAAGVPP